MVNFPPKSPIIRGSYRALSEKIIGLFSGKLFGSFEENHP